MRRRRSLALLGSCCLVGAVALLAPPALSTALADEDITPAQRMNKVKLDLSITIGEKSKDSRKRTYKVAIDGHSLTYSGPIGKGKRGRFENGSATIDMDEALMEDLLEDLDEVGFDVVDAGSLAESWRFERAKPAYCIPLDREGLRQALAEAQRDIDMPEGSWRR